MAFQVGLISGMLYSDVQGCHFIATVAWVVVCGLQAVKYPRLQVRLRLTTAPFFLPALQSMASCRLMTTSLSTMFTWRYGKCNLMIVAEGYRSIVVYQAMRLLMHLQSKHQHSLT